MGRLMLWTVPRSKSTVLLKSISSSPHVKCIFEPFAFSFFGSFYDDRFNFSDLEKIIDQEPFTCDNVVWKDVPSCVENLDFDKWVKDDRFKHALLVRHPREVALSQIGVNGEPEYFMNFLEMNTRHARLHQCYQDMLLLIEHLEKRGMEYRVFDTSSLGSNGRWSGSGDVGEDLVWEICEFGLLPFDREKMLNMKSYDALPDHWWKTPTAYLINNNKKTNFDFHGTAMRSTEFKTVIEKQRRPLTEEEEKRLQESVEKSMPHYEKLISLI